MSVSKLWLNASGDVLLDENGDLLECDDCPCVTGPPTGTGTGTFIPSICCPDNPLPESLNFQFDYPGGSTSYAIVYNSLLGGWEIPGSPPTPFDPGPNAVWVWGILFYQSLVGCFRFKTEAYPPALGDLRSPKPVSYLNWLACGSPPSYAYDPCAPGPPCICAIGANDAAAFSYVCDPLSVVGYGYVT